jgi:hypothetical protein
MVFFDELAGTATTSVTLPLEQGIVAGNPLTTLFDENAQLVALVTAADKVTDPPKGPREDGVTANDDAVGFAGSVVAAADWGNEDMQSTPTINMTALAAEARLTLMACSFFEGRGQRVGAQRRARIVDQRQVNGATWTVALSCALTRRGLPQLIAPTTIWEIDSNSVGNGCQHGAVQPGQTSFVGSPLNS